ncbi:MAG: iron-sulfur cluster assembly scaffold protein [Acidobacteria bacterium]|nr:iron-sulfur cluster assembly scaffold protein [Acidobacteriota bacterium]
MFTSQVLDHFENPRHAGELPPPAITVEVSNPACGDILRLSALVEQGRFQQVRFKARGCVASIACGSLLTELMQGKTLEQAAQISAAQVVTQLGGLPPESGHAAILAADALHAILKEAHRLAP